MIHNVNLVARFFLELAALAAAGTWGFAAFDGWLARIAFGIGIPLALAAVWGVFRVPSDGGPPVVAVHPTVRLAIEWAFFAVAVGLLHAAGNRTLAFVLLALVVVHYAVGYKRTLAFLRGRRFEGGFR